MFPRLASVAIALMVLAGSTAGVFAAGPQPGGAGAGAVSAGSSTSDDQRASAGYDRLLDRRRLASPGGYGSSVPDINGQGREPYDQRDFGRLQDDAVAGSGYGLRGSRSAAHERGWGGYERDYRLGNGD